MNFESLLASGRTLHAVCFVGDDTGSLAEEAAITFLCERKGNAPCGLCQSCKKARDKLHPDIIRVRETAKEQKYTVGGLRDIVMSAVLRPNDGDLKVYIFTDADTMRPDSQNTLLKFTEEPPEFVRIIFTAKSADGFLETIKSRFVFINALPPALRATSLEEGGNEIVQSFMSAFSEKDEYRAAVALSKIKTRDDLSFVLELISAALRDKIVAGSANVRELARAQKFLMSCINDLQFNPNIGLATTYIAHNILN